MGDEDEEKALHFNDRKAHTNAGLMKTLVSLIVSRRIKMTPTRGPAENVKMLE